MSVDPEDLARQLAELSRRVAGLEATLSAMRSAPTPPANAPQAAPPTEHQADPSPTPHSRRPPQPGTLPPALPQRVPLQPPLRTPAQSTLESRIGSQLFNRIGIVTLLFGAAWFLKFAIDKHWIGPAGRVLIGLASGLALIGWSQWFRLRAYRSFAYSLQAVGTGILYLSLWAAYTLFGLIPSSVAFLAMVLVTVTNAWLCWRQNSELLAFYAAIGGLLTPLLLWSAESQELTLFSYLLLLDLAVLALVAMRPWSRLLLIAFAGTAVYAIGWYIQHYTPAALGLTTFFVAAIFLLFSAAPQLLRNLRLATSVAQLTVEDHLALLLLPLLNALLAFSELYALLSEPLHTSLRAWVAFAFSAFYLAMLRLARSPRLAGTPTRLPDTYLLLSVLALTGAMPLAFNGRSIAVAWSAESALLLALAWRLAQPLLRTLGGSVLALAWLAAIALNTALAGDVRLLLNERFATYLAAIAACLLAAWIATRASSLSQSDDPSGSGWRLTGLLASWAAAILLMIAVCLEIATYWSGQLNLPPADRIVDEQFSLSAWTMAFGAALLAAGFWRKATTLRWQGLVLLALSIAKVFLFDLRSLSQGYRILSFLVLGILLLAVSFAYQRNLLGLRKSE